MRTYDLVLVLKTSLSDKDRKKTLDAVKGFLKGATFANEASWGQKPLAYAIKKEVAGVYEKMEIAAESIPADFEKKLFQNESVLRFLLLRTK